MRFFPSAWLLLLPLALFATVCPRAIAEQTAARQRIAFPDPRLGVYGLPWFSEDKPALRRLPLRLKDKFRPPVWDLAQDPSGGRIRFRTDSTTIGLVAENSHFSNMHHMASVGENGFDLYVGHDYLGSAWPDGTGKITKEWRVGRERKMRDITFYLPLYKAVTIQELSLDPGAHLERATPYAIHKPIVYYGSSITQGGCASNPGGSCQAILERRLDDFESDPPFAEGDKRRFGYSRDKRFDCVQVVIALVVTPEGFPLGYEVLPGNTLDKKTLKTSAASGLAWTGTIPSVIT